MKPSDHPVSLMETDEYIISLSQEEYLRQRRYVKPEFPASSTGHDEPSDFPAGIVIGSLHGTSQQEGGNERAAVDGLFGTPPENFASAGSSQARECRDGRTETLPIYGESNSEVVNLGRDADLVFSEGDFPAPVGRDESRVLKGGTPPENFNLGESCSKRSKLTSQRMQPRRGEVMNFFTMLSSKSLKDPSLTMGEEENTGFEREGMKTKEKMKKVEGKKETLNKRVLPPSITERWTSAGAAKAVPVAKTATEAAREEVDKTTRNTSDAGGGEALKISGCSTDDRVGEAAATAEIGDLGGGAVGKNERIQSDPLLHMVKAVMLITGSQSKSPAEEPGILEIAKRMGLKFPIPPPRWPPGKEEL